MTRQPLSMILALADDGTLGDKGGIPWDLPADRRRFAGLTRGRAVIMGRKTWESLPGPLTGRRCIVVSNRGMVTMPAGSYVPGEAEVWGSVDGALAAARLTDPEPFIIGGVSLYMDALPLATRIYLTEVHLSPGGDTNFAFNRNGWETAWTARLTSATGIAYTLRDLVRSSS